MSISSPARRLPLLVAILLSLVGLPACHNDSNDPGNQPAMISGQGFDGPIAGGTVTAFAIDGQGAKGATLATATTDADGTYSLAIEAYSGPVLLEITGGTYVDAATGNPVTLTGTLSAVEDAVGPGDVLTIQITPLTTLAASLAQGSPGGLTAGNVTSANATVGAYFGGLDLLGTTPVDPTVADSATGASQAAIDYGLILGGLSAEAAELGLPDAQALIVALAADIADGIFDGLAEGEPIALGEGTMGSGTGTTDLGDAIEDFSDDAEGNLSGGTVSEEAVSALQNPEPPSGPTGVTTTPGNGQVTVAWTAVSGATGYKVYLSDEPGIFVPEDFFTDSVAAASSPTVITGLTSGVPYYFVVTALNLGGESGQSAEVTGTPAAVTYTVGGTVSGLTGTGLVLRNNGGDDKSIAASGAFTFATPIGGGGTYAVTVATQPSGQTCSVASGSGTVAAANVSNVQVTCAATGGGGNSATLNVSGATPSSGNGAMVVSAVTVEADTLDGDPITRVKVTGTINGLSAEFTLYYVTATGDAFNASLNWDNFANFVFKDPAPGEVLIDKPNGQINLDIVTLNDVDGIIITNPTKFADVSATINVTPPLP